MFQPRNECVAMQGLWKNMLRDNGVRDEAHTNATVPSCPVVAEAVRLGTGKPPVWGPCMVAKPGVVGTEAHMKACLGSWYPPSFSSPVSNLKSCDEVYDRYEMALWHASPYSVQMRGRRDPSGAPMREEVMRYGPSPFVDPAIVPDKSNSSIPRLAKRDCALVAGVMASFSGGKEPRWAACMGYAPDNVAAHVKKCLGAMAGSGKPCADGRAAYEENIKAANGGMLPESYKPVSCDVLAPILAQVKQAVVATPATSEPPGQMSTAAPPAPVYTRPRSTGEMLAMASVLAGLGLIFDHIAVRLFNRRKISAFVEEKFPLTKYTATTAGSHTYSRTHVHGTTSGGGGYIGPYGGHNSAPTTSISSTVEDRHEFFLLYPSGFEQSVWVRGAQTFPTREGQEITALWHTEPGQEKLLAVHNPATRMRFLFDDDIAAKARNIPTGPADWLVRLLLAALIFAVLASLHLETPAMVAAATFAALATWLRSRSLVRWGSQNISQKLIKNLP